MGSESSTIDQSLTRQIDTSFIMYTDHQYEQMSNYLEQMDVSSTENDSVHLDYFYALSMSYVHQRRYDEYFEAIVNGLMLAQESQHRWMLLSFYREFASFHDEHLDDFDSSLKYFEEAIKYLDAVDSLSKTGLMMDIGLTCANAKEFDKAAEFYEQAFAYVPSWDSIIIYDVYSFYTPYLLEIGKPDSAIKYATLAYDKWKSVGFTGGAIESACDLAQGYLDVGLPSKALEYVMLAESEAKEYDNIHFYADVLELQAEVQEANGLLLESQKTYRELSTIQDSIELIAKNDKIDEIRIDFLTSKFKSEIESINAYNRSLTAMISKERNAFKYAISLLGGMLILMGLFFARRKKRLTMLAANLESTKSEYENLKKQYHINIAELESNKRKLTSNALFLEKKDETLRTLRKILLEMKSHEGYDVSKKLFSATKLAEQSIKIDNNWESFRYFFEQVFPSFNKVLIKRYPELNPNERRILSYIKMGLTDKEASRLLAINTASFQKSKYRLKKKLNIRQEGSLNDIVQDLDLATITD